jgi:glycosyltransferase involved in cell wall biosynthesis
MVERAEVIKVHISPSYLDKRDTGDGGIRRVSEAMIKHLPAFGIEHVRNFKEADIIINHGTDLLYVLGKPNININHGLYWSRQPWMDNYQEANANAVESMSRAVAHTAPSEWVNRALRRGGLWYPETVYHGVDADQFAVPETHGNYVLWNKARADYVSNPDDMQNVAALMDNVEFRSTIGRATHNVKILGAMPYDQMKEIVAEAGVYLATARETFGIGILEALACGVPVAGWDWGGMSEIVVQGMTGYLAPPGDYKTLAQCIQRCFSDRERLSVNARADVEKNWGWEKRIAQYADIIKRVYHHHYEIQRPRVSVIVTTYKLDRYLPDALDSVMRQSLGDFECLVIDDANSHLTWKIVEDYEKRDSRFKYLATPNNFGLSGARNFGFSHATGRYIRHLDADDWLADNALSLESDMLDREPGMHIVYGHLEVVNEDGSRNLDRNGEPLRSSWPPNQFDWIGQMAHLNQLPSCVMARREVYERAGGYRERMKRNEDAEFWCRVTSLGFRARKVTQAVTYYHRQRNDSKGATEWAKEGKEPDWTAWYPWRVGAGDYQEAVKILRKHNGLHPAPHLVPFGAQGQAPGRRFWYVHDHAYPVVSVIVTVGPGHESYLLDALDSIQAQSYPDWECIVVNDTGSLTPLTPALPQGGMENVMGAPFARVVSTGGNLGAAAARNAGYPHARGKFIVWMDADDIWLPWFLEVLVAHAERNDGVVYSDCLLQKQDDLTIHRFENFNEEGVAANMRYAGTSVLIPRKIAKAVFDLQGGWDTEIPGKEDHDWQIAVHSMKFCAYRVAEPLFVYRMYSSTKREKDFAKIDIISEYLNKKWFDYRIGGKQFMCNCGGTKPTQNQPASLLSGSGNFNIAEDFAMDTATQMVKVEYIGPRAETFSIRSRAMPDKMYRFGNNPHHKEQTVFMQDAEFLLSLMEGERPQWRVLAQGASMDQRDPAAALGAAITG